MLFFVLGGGDFFPASFVGKGRGYFCQPGYGALDLKAACFLKMFLSM